MRIYLAARYSRHLELQNMSAVLTALGHVVTSRWILGNHQMPECAVGTPDEERIRQQFAAEDLDDLRAAECCISFTEEPRAATRGGRHTEFGIALERGQKLIVVGPREHVFHWLPAVEWYADRVAMALALGAAEAT